MNQIFRTVIDFRLRNFKDTRSKLRENEGLWVVNFAKKANYETLSGKERASLQKQIDAIIKKRYSFISMDGITSKNMARYQRGRILDNAVLVVDEVHNITNAMSKDKPGIRASGVRKLIMEAENLKCVLRKITEKFLMQNLLGLPHIFE